MDIIVKKHLCSQEINSTVYLLLQVADVILLVLVLHMPFRVTRSANTEIPVLSYLFHQLIGITETILIRECHIRGNIPAQREDILNPEFFKVLDHSAHFRFCGGRACQMGKA